MCELLGLSFNQPVRCSYSFKGFRRRGRSNPDGWGIARFEDNASQVFKEPIEACASTLASFLLDYEPFQSKIFIGHVRHSSGTKSKIRNTHPFVRAFRSREVVLAHNGTLHLDISKSELRFKPVGDTDSEQLFCALLTRLYEKRIKFTDYGKIEMELHHFNEYGTMNLLFSEGKHLFCYRDKKGHSGLCMTRREAPFDKLHLEDEDLNIHLFSQKGPDQKGFVIATSPLTKENWEPLKPGSLYVFKNGGCVYGQDPKD